ncbi:MAG: response regulator transcription factor [Lachnospiraceae bacterium]|nr:response regulator transcription factor [Lachnospiraceae bacterium]
MYSVFLADDEQIIREGIKYIIDWESFDFEIVGEASNGSDALDYILNNNPDLVLLDVRMPKMIGTEVVKAARENGYKGKIIILSGFTDFKYTQAAISYGVDYYLAKPVDEDELSETVKKIKKSLDETVVMPMSNYYQNKTKQFVLYDLLHNNIKSSELESMPLDLNADSYQVVIYEQYSHHETKIKYKFRDLLNVGSNVDNSFENLMIDNNDVFILKGDFIIKKFNQFLSHYVGTKKPQKNSPLDTLFIAYGEVVYDLKDVHKSYEEASLLMQRRFFCKKSQHTIGFDELPPEKNENAYKDNPDLLSEFCTSFVNNLQMGKRNKLNDQLDELSDILFDSFYDVPRIKLFLTDLFLSVKDKISNLYHNSGVNFESNATIIEFISNQYYLYRIMNYFSEQFDMIINTIGNTSSESVMDNIIHYIKHNYMNDIKLETLAPMFGYNSSYLGKIFSQQVGEGFNVFVDNIRIEKSKELLENSSLKVYEIAERVGYHNVDYFHTKFKKYVKISPAEYRKQILNKNKKDD